MIGSRQSFLPLVFVWLGAFLSFHPPLSHAGPVLLQQTGQQACWDADGNALTSCSGTGQDGDLRQGEAWPSPRFTDNGQTITDNLTGLIWLKDANIIKTNDQAFDGDGAKDGCVTWQHSLDYVAVLNQRNYLGYNDWRLPNIRELRSLIHYGGQFPSDWLKSPGQGFVNVADDYYWTSTSSALSRQQAWAAALWFGETTVRNKSESLYVWPVRAGH